MRNLAATAVLLALAVGVTTAARGQELFTDIGAGLTGVDECSLAWGDYDGDGDLDLALAGRAGGGMYVSKVYRNDGGTFTDIGAGLTGVSSCSLAWGDYDNDGDLDLALAGAWYDSSWHRVGEVYRNDGGTFTDIGAELTGVSSCSLAWGDYDNDGDLDLALAGYRGGSKVYRNDGGTFTDISAGLTGVSSCSLAWGDYDNDGDLDLALAGNPGGGNVSEVYRNDGGTFTDIGAGLTGVETCSLAWGDYDNDGDLDLALAGRAGGGMYVSKVYRNDGGTFTDSAAGLTGVRYSCLAWGDYDNDGDLDLALAGSDFGTRVSKVYRNDGGVFTDIGAGLTGVWECSLAWGDYDNDGDLDLALAGDGDRGRVSMVYRNDGGVFNTAPSTPTGLSAGVSANEVTLSWTAATDTETPQAGLTYNLRVGSTPEAGDVFSGMADATTGYRRIPAPGNAQENTSWTVSLPAGTNYWSVQSVDTGFAGSAWAAEQSVFVPVAVSSPNGGERWDVGSSRAITWTASGIANVNIDLSRDGGTTWERIASSLDASLGSYPWIVTRPLSKTCVIRVSDASAPATADTSDFAFAIPRFMDIGAGLTGVSNCSLAWGDYDNDGDLDLALAGASRSSYVYRYDGGTFTDIGAGLTGVTYCFLAWGDYDNDGDLDLALAGTPISGRVSKVYRNDGGTFTDIAAALTGVRGSLGWGDYDNDGDLDLALAGYDGSDYVSKVYRNDGGTFTDIGAGLTGVARCSLAWGDYDNDGDLDLALAGNSGSGYVSKVYRNDGGTFTAIGAGLTGVSSCSVAWGDYDNDGDLDLALAGYGGSKVYRNDGGMFTDISAALTEVGAGCSLAWGDYDNDGDLDLALAGNHSSSRVYRNDGGRFTDIGAGLTGVSSCSIAWGDYDDDGDLDLALAGYAGSGTYVSKVYRNDGGVFDTLPSAPGDLSANASGGAATFTWSAATDAETPQAGLTYNLRVGTTPGGDEVSSGMADSASGRRRIPAMGNAQKLLLWTLKPLPSGTYYWSVQAVDAAFAGSPWAAGAAVTMQPGIAVLSPDGGETWYYQGEDRVITWTSLGVAGNVDIHYSGDWGSTWTAVATDVTNTGSYAWTVPNEDSAQCLVRVQETGGAGLSDVSDAPFTIAQKKITLTLPLSATENDGTLVAAGEVLIPGTWTTDLVIDLESSDTTELTVPATVTIPQGETLATFDLTVEEDGKHDGTQTATVTASATGWMPGTAKIDVQDNDPVPKKGGCAAGAARPVALGLIALALLFAIRQRRRRVLGAR